MSLLVSFWTGQSVKRLRKSLGLTQKQLAAIAGVSPITLSHWEQGHNVIKTLYQDRIQFWQWECRQWQRLYHRPLAPIVAWKDRKPADRKTFQAWQRGEYKEST